MAIRTRTARLRSRLQRLSRELPTAATGGAYDAAEAVKNFVHVQISQDWQGAATRQVGFDMGHFMDITDRVEAVEGSLGIFNVQRMGTADDFEAISGVPDLWHMGMRMNDSFRRLIIERPANRDMLADARKSVWGDKEPQWWFLNYGNVGYAGAYPTHPGTFSIEQVAFTSDRSVEQIVERSVNEYLRQRGILV